MKSALTQMRLAALVVIQNPLYFLRGFNFYSKGRLLALHRQGIVRNGALNGVLVLPGQYRVYPLRKRKPCVCFCVRIAEIVLGFVRHEVIIWDS